MSNTTKVLYALYVAIVLIVAGTARADEIYPIDIYQSPVQISHVGVDYQTRELLVAGELPNPCFAEPTAQLVKDADSPNTLIIRLTSPIPTSMCVTKIKNYDKIISLPELAKAAQLNLEEKSSYVIKTEGYPFELVLVGSDLIQ